MSKLKKECIVEVLGYKQNKNNDFCYVKWKYSKPSWENIKDITSYIEFDKFINKLMQFRDTIKKLDSETKLQNHLNSLLQQHKKNTLNEQISNGKIESTIEKELCTKNDLNRTYKQEKNNFSNTQITNKKVSYNQNLVKVNEYDGLKKNKLLYKNRKNEEDETVKHQMYTSQNINQGLFANNNRRYFHKIETVVKPIVETQKIINRNEVNVFVQDKNVATLINVLNIDDDSCIHIKSINFNKVTKLTNIVNIFFTAKQNESCFLIETYRATLSKSTPAYDNWCNKIQSNSLCFVDDTNTNFVYFFTWSNSQFHDYALDFEFLIFKVKKEYIVEDLSFFSTNKIYENNLQWNIDTFGFDKRLENYFITNFFDNNIKNKSTFLLHGIEQNYLSKYLYDFLIDCNFEYRKNAEDIIDTVFVYEKCADIVHLIPNVDNLLSAKTEFFLYGLTNKTKFLLPIFISGSIITIFDSFFATKIIVDDLYKLLCCIQETATWDLKIPTKVHKKLYKVLVVENYKKSFFIWLESCVENLQSENDNEYFNQFVQTYKSTKRYFYALSDHNLDYRFKSLYEMLKMF